MCHQKDLHLRYKRFQKPVFDFFYVTDAYIMQITLAKQLPVGITRNRMIMLDSLKEIFPSKTKIIPDYV